MEPGASVILSTLDSMSAAQTLACELVEQKLAACVNILPGAHSIYEWEGKLCEAQECLLIIKTPSDKVQALSAALESLHPYDCPELLCLDADASAPYLQWLKMSE